MFNRSLRKRIKELEYLASIADSRYSQMASQYIDTVLQNHNLLNEFNLLKKKFDDYIAKPDYGYSEFRKNKGYLPKEETQTLKEKYGSEDEVQ